MSRYGHQDQFEVCIEAKLLFGNREFRHFPHMLRPAGGYRQPEEQRYSSKYGPGYAWQLPGAFRMK
jgi:hypothetical protein